MPSRAARTKNPRRLETVAAIGFGQIVEGFQQMTDAGRLGIAT